jgi:hypothetical protein
MQGENKNKNKKTPFVDVIKGGRLLDPQPIHKVAMASIGFFFFHNKINPPRGSARFSESGGLLAQQNQPTVGRAKAVIMVHGGFARMQCYVRT